MLSPTDSTKQFMTGVDIHAPNAKLSADIPIDFNVADAAGATVFDPGHEPLFSNPETVGDAWTPVAPSADWKDDMKMIMDEWKERENIAQNVVDMWKKISALKTWDTTSLSGHAPLGTIERFEELYLSMPALTASG